MRSTLVMVAVVLLAAGGIVYALLVVANDLRHVSDDLEVVARNMSVMGEDVRSIADDVNAIADALAGGDDDEQQGQSTSASMVSGSHPAVRIAHARRSAAVRRTARQRTPRLVAR